MSAPLIMSRYHVAEQTDGRGWMVLKLDEIGSNKVTVLLSDLPEDGARTMLADLRAGEVST
ncbi:MAG TPA: hypothetical protein VJU58_04025 [Microbacterium sp.]|nr:hypothetical protein [Microbacterium sp.]